MSPVEAIANSLMFATAATVIAVVLGAMASWAIGLVRALGPGRARWTDTVLMIPLGTSAVTVGFGFLIALDKPPLDLRQSLWLIPSPMPTVALPFVVRLVVPALRSIDQQLRDAAACSAPRRGGSGARSTSPWCRRALVAAAGFAFAVSLGEFGATVFLARPDRPTVPVAIYRFLGQPGALNFGQAMALSTILMALTVAVMLVIERLRPAGASEF